MLEMLTHGVNSPQRDRPAGLVIGETDPEQAGVLWSDDIDANARSPRIVALFACGTALGPTRMGDDSAAQLGNAFLRQGACAVLLSRGKLEYRAMIALAETFNKEIRVRGQSTAEALRRSRSKLADNAEWNDPFYLGQVSVVGLGLMPMSAEVEAPTEEPHGLSNSASTAVRITGLAGATALAAWLTYRWRRNRSRAA
jgi:CHAT domain-containing protein